MCMRPPGTEHSCLVCRDVHKKCEFDASSPAKRGKERAQGSAPPRAKRAPAQPARAEHRGDAQDVSMDEEESVDDREDLARRSPTLSGDEHDGAADDDEVDVNGGDELDDAIAAADLLSGAADAEGAFLHAPPLVAAGVAPPAAPAADGSMDGESDSDSDAGAGRKRVARPRSSASTRVKRARVGSSDEEEEVDLVLGGQGDGDAPVNIVLDAGGAEPQNNEGAPLAPPLVKAPVVAPPAAPMLTLPRPRITPDMTTVQVNAVYAKTQEIWSAAMCKAMMGGDLEAARGFSQYIDELMAEWERRVA